MRSRVAGTEPVHNFPFCAEPYNLAAFPVIYICALDERFAVMRS